MLVMLASHMSERDPVGETLFLSFATFLVFSSIAAIRSPVGVVRFMLKLLSLPLKPFGIGLPEILRSTPVHDPVVRFVLQEDESLASFTEVEQKRIRRRIRLARIFMVLTLVVAILMWLIGITNVVAWFR